MSQPSRLVREPLVHFVVAGALLFAAFTAFRGGEDAGGGTGTTITVDRRDLLTFLQYRANAFEAETFGAALDAMTDAELEELVDAYVREEVLYREARALGLEESDNIIRQRMVQKMSFLLADVAASGEAPDPEALASYFEANIDAYAIEPWATFTHVFFDSAERGADGARRAAGIARDELNAAGAGFNDAAGIGDRFPYHRNYVERTIEYIASHFGAGFAANLESLEPSAGEWRGPLRSAYGEHIVLLTRRVERSDPTLEAVRAEVERDYAQQEADAALAGMTGALRDRYEVEVGQLRSTSGPAAVPGTAPGTVP